MHPMSETAIVLDRTLIPRILQSG